jgi:hypothetical protein
MTDTKAPAAKKKTTEKPNKFKTLVRCTVKSVNGFNTSVGPSHPVFTGPNLERRLITYYETDKSHVMPLAHAMDLIRAKLVIADSMKPLSDQKTPVTGVTVRAGDPAPVFKQKAFDADEYEDGKFDVDEFLSGKE